jgi:hypothetical protein
MLPIAHKLLEGDSKVPRPILKAIIPAVPGHPERRIYDYAMDTDQTIKWDDPWAGAGASVKRADNETIMRPIATVVAGELYQNRFEPETEIQADTDISEFTPKAVNAN